MAITLPCHLEGAVKTFSFTSANVSIKGIVSDSFIGQVVQPLGDINNDAMDDLIIGAPDRSTQRGAAFIMTSPTLKTSTLLISNATASINGQTINQFTGKFLATNGDLDGDGLSDLVIATPLNSLISIYLGKDRAQWQNRTSTWFRSSYLNNAANTNLPQFLSISGDINGDGFSDLLIGASNDFNDENPKGRTYLILGRSDIDNDDLNDLSLENSPSVNIVFQGEKTDDGTGYSVAIIPDCNADGYDDILIGSFRQNGNGTGRQVYLIYGRPDYSKLSSGNIFQLSNADAIFESQTNGTDGFGETVSGLGDINGDGYGDFAIGAPKTNANQGAVYIFYGSPNYPFKGKTKNGWSTKISGSSTNTEIGLHAIAGLGDVTGDGIGDIGIGELWNSATQTNAGRAHIIPGEDTPIPATENLSIQTAETIVITSNQANAQIGFTLAGGFDLNQDGIDEVIVGARNTNSSKGQASIFSFATNITPNVNSGTLKVYSNSNFTDEKNEFKNLEFIYLQLNGFDTKTSSISATEIWVSSDSQIKPVKIRLYDSPFHDKKYRQKILLTQTRPNNKINQIFARPNDSIYIVSKDNPSLRATLSMGNSKPTMAIENIEQIGTGNAAEIHIDFSLFDTNSDTISFTNSPDQIQFSKNKGKTWINATTKSPPSSLDSNIHGISHSGLNAIIWDAATDVGVTNNAFLLRFKPFDGIASSEHYITSNAFMVDNLAPDAPILDTLLPKHSYVITVRGLAEPKSFVSIFVNGIKNKETTTNSEGVFVVEQVNVSPTQTIITAQSEDAVGFKSPLSGSQTVTFAPFYQEFTSSRSDASLYLPIDTLNTDKVLTFQSENRFSTSPPAPHLYQFMDAFQFLVGGNSETHPLNQDATITLNLTFELLTTRSVMIVYRTTDDTPTWSSDGIHITKLTPSEIVFKTKTLGVFGLAQYIDPFQASVSLIKINNKVMETNKFYGPSPYISVSLADDDSGIASWSITLQSLNTNSIISEASQSNITSSLNVEAALDLTSTLLDSGNYIILVKVWDNNGNITETYDIFAVDSSELFVEIIGGPNPYNPKKGDFIFGLNYTLPIDQLDIHLIALNGKHIWDYQASNSEKSAGYHTIPWDGKDSFNTPVPNGTYLAYCIYKKDGIKKTKLIRIAVLR